MGYITKHLYVTKAQKSWGVPRPGDILPSSLPHAEADCLCAWGGPVSLNLIANILFFFFFFRSHVQKNNFYLNVTSTCKGANPQHHQCIVSCQKPEKLYVGFSSKCQGSDCRRYPCSFWRTLSTSWFGVKGWGWGIVSVFITRGNVWSDHHHACRSKAE